MRKILYILVLLVSVKGYGQAFRFGSPSAISHLQGKVVVDSALILPDTLKSATIGAFGKKDSTVFIKTASGWKPVGGLDTAAVNQLIKDSSVKIDLTNNRTNYIPILTDTVNKIFTLGPAPSGFSKDSVFQNIHIKAYATLTALRAATDYVNGATHAVTQGYYAQGDGGQAEYRWNSSSAAADDSSFVINPTGNAGSGRWLLLVRNNQINFLAIGAKSDYSGAHTDNAWTFDKAMNFMVIAGNKCSNLYIPWGGDSYFFSRPLYVKGFNTAIIGDRGVNNPRTVLYWHSTSFIQCLNSNVQFVHLENLQVRDEVTNSNSTVYNVDNIGIFLNCAFDLENIFETDAKGDGIRAYGSTTDPRIPANVNDCNARNIVVRSNLGDGWAIYGSDGNQGTFVNIKAFESSGWNIRDGSLLGNVYIGGEASYTGYLQSRNSCTLTSGGHTYYYFAKKDHINQPPTAGASNPYWQLWATDTDPWGGLGVAWNSATRYYGSGSVTAGFTSYPLINDSLYTLGTSLNRTHFNGIYNEGGQPGAVLDGHVLYFPTTCDPGVNEGMFLQVVGGKLYNPIGIGGDHVFFGSNESAYINYVPDSNPYTIFNSDQNMFVGSGHNYYLGTNGSYNYKMDSTGKSLWIHGVDARGLSGDGVNAFQYYLGDPAVHGDYGWKMEDRNNGGVFVGLHAGMAAPTTGTWLRGDIVFNSQPTTGAAMYWRCTVAGTPGTWETVTAGTGGGSVDTTVISTRAWRQKGIDSITNLLTGYELLSNKSTTTTLGTSNILYPTQNAVKTYVDAAVAGATGASAPTGQMIYGTGTGYTSSAGYTIDNPGWPRFNVSGVAAEIKFNASGGHNWRWIATATSVGFSQANSMALYDENSGAYRFQIDGSGNVIHPAYAGTGNKLIYYDNTGMLIRSTIDPANVLTTSSTINVSQLTGTLPVANGGTGTTSPGIVAGTGVTVTGTWPNQTVNATSATIDATPTSGSANAVQSGGVFTALGLKADVASPTFTGVITTPKVKGNGTAPTVAVGANVTGTISVSGTDVAGEVTLVITSASGLATNDELFTLTFNSAYGTAPFVVYAPSSATSSTTMASSYIKTRGTTSFTLGIANSGTYAATTYKWNYHVIQ